MKTFLKNNLLTGVIFGVILISLSMIGFTLTISELFGDLFDISLIAGLSLFLTLMGFFAGSSAMKKSEEASWRKAILTCVITGVVSALLLSVLTVIIFLVDQAGVNMRTELPNLSPALVNLLVFNTGNLIKGILTLSGIIIAGALVGGLLQVGFFRAEWRKSASNDLRKKMRGLWKTETFSNIKTSPITRYVLITLGIAALIIIPQFLNESWNLNLGTVGIYVLMGLGLNLVVGTAGLLNLGYVAFFAIGAYSIGLLTAPAPLGLQWNFWLVLVIGILVSTLFGLLLGIPVLRLRGDYLAIVTLGFGEITRIMLKSDLLEPWTGGPRGVRDIAQPVLFGLPIDTKRAYLYVIMAFIALAIYVTIKLQYSRAGRAWVAMREDETVAKAMGINTLKYKLMAFAIGAAFGGLAGVLFAARNYFTGPEDHTLMVSVNVLSEIIVGGMNSIPGIILGSFVLKGLPEILRQVESFRMITFGGLLVVMMIWRPEGLWPSKRKSIARKIKNTEEAGPVGVGTIEPTDVEKGAI